MSTALTTNPLIAAFAGEPALLDSGAEVRFEACLNAVANHEHREVLMNERAAEGDGFWLSADDWRSGYRPYIVDTNGVLQIPIRGVLLNNFPWQLGGWATGYEYIWRAFERGMADPLVRAVALVVDSPGGMVAGNFDLVDRMFKMRGTKPIAGFAHESAYSAAYSIISVADPGRIYVSRTGGVGSIGIVTSHYDVSGLYEKMGVKVTWLFEADGKVDGNPTEPLSDRARERIMARIGKLYSVFVSTVARNRGLKDSAVRALKSFTYDADDALSNGLADKIGALDDAMTAFSADLDDYYSNDGDDEMTTNTTGSVAQADHETAVASARTEGANTGKTDERARISAIMGCDEAKGRDTLANHIAFNTDMTVDQAKGMLAASPKAEAAPAAAAPAAPAADAAAATFHNAMDATGTPGVGGGDGGAQGQGAANPDDHTGTLALLQSAGVGRFIAPAK